MTTTTPLTIFALDTEDAQKNFNLAVWYENQNHLTPAMSYFLRASERTEDNLLAYESLIRGFFCFDNQGHREVSAQSMLHQALLVDPKRPEAYYLLSRYFEKKQDWMHSYMFANLGIQIAEHNNISLQTDVGYLGKYALLFQKVVSGWWWGKAQECRDILKDLVDNYWDQMPKYYQDTVENNFSRLGLTKDSQNYIRYSESQHDKLRYNFKNSEKIKTNYSQVYQDMFVLSMTDGKQNGTFVEIGGAQPYHNNNTALLETNYGWKGISVELNDEYANEYQQARPNVNLYHTDATKLNYFKVFKENFDTSTIDYLQLDIEPAKNTFEVLLSIPFDDYKFKVITYEHDYYVDITKSFRNKSRRYLKSMGYELVVNDISTDGVSTFEDWWVHPDLVDREILSKMKDAGDNVKKIENYILNK